MQHVCADGVSECRGDATVHGNRAEPHRLARGGIISLLLRLLAAHLRVGFLHGKESESKPSRSERPLRT